MISAISGSVSTKGFSISCELSEFESLDIRGKVTHIPVGLWKRIRCHDFVRKWEMSGVETVDRSACRLWWDEVV